MKLNAYEHNPSSMRKCAFCKYWYDPTNAAINPLKGIGRWEFDPTVRNRCRKKNGLPTLGKTTCQYFESKI